MEFGSTQHQANSKCLNVQEQTEDMDLFQYWTLQMLTLYKAASDPTYLKRGGAQCAHTSVLGLRCPERPNDDSPLNF